MGEIWYSEVYEDFEILSTNIASICNFQPCFSKSFAIRRDQGIVYVAVHLVWPSDGCTSYVSSPTVD